MTPFKRFCDLVAALLFGALLLPMFLVISVAIILLDGRPVFYFSERMRSPKEAFTLVKFRTMTPSHNDTGVTGGDKSHRITRTGRMLRRTRLDETPQLWNILRGDISLVGPRPPLRQYVEQFPDLYSQVLRSRPGVTGLATIIFISMKTGCWLAARHRKKLMPYIHVFAFRGRRSST